MSLFSYTIVHHPCWPLEENLHANKNFYVDNGKFQEHNILNLLLCDIFIYLILHQNIFWYLKQKHLLFVFNLLKILPHLLPIERQCNGKFINMQRNRYKMIKSSGNFHVCIVLCNACPSPTFETSYYKPGTTRFVHRHRTKYNWHQNINVRIIKCMKGCVRYSKKSQDEEKTA